MTDTADPPTGLPTDKPGRGTLIVHLTPGTPRSGLWCDRCLTSARIEVDVHILGSDGPRRISVIDKCARCDSAEDADHA